MPMLRTLLRSSAMDVILGNEVRKEDPERRSGEPKILAELGEGFTALV